MFFDSVSGALSDVSVSVENDEIAALKTQSKLQQRIQQLKNKTLRLVKGNYEGVLSGIQLHAGHVYTVKLPEYLCSDKDGKSSIVLYEDGRRLPHPHAMHSEIAEVGEGRYSHWESWLLFTTSDNSDPTQNGRTYAVREE
ncbi:MAG: hypothetical protein U0136_10910 [Bdellovibrionota bacterium]